MKDILNQLQVEYKPTEHQGAIIWLKNAPANPSWNDNSWNSNSCVQEDHYCYQVHKAKEVFAFFNRLPKVANYS